VPSSLSPEQLRARAELAAKRRHHGDQAVLSDEAAALERAALRRRLGKAVDDAALLPLEERARQAARLLAAGDAP
jgi:hypothetical protein